MNQPDPSLPVLQPDPLAVQRCPVQQLEGEVDTLTVFEQDESEGPLLSSFPVLDRHQVSYHNLQVQQTYRYRSFIIHP